MGLNVENIKYKSMEFTLWDVSGQATKLWKHYFDKINAIIFVVDSTDQERLERARDELHKIVDDEELCGAPVLVLANKQDLPGALSADEVFAEMSLQHIIDEKKKELAYQGCSAKTGDGIWEGI